MKNIYIYKVGISQFQWLWDEFIVQNARRPDITRQWLTRCRSVLQSTRNGFESTIYLFGSKPPSGFDNFTRHFRVSSFTVNNSNE